MVQNPKKNQWYNCRYKGRYIAVKVVGFGFDTKNVVFIQTKSGNHYKCNKKDLFNPLTTY